MECGEATMPNKSASLELWGRAVRHLETNDPEVLEWARGVGEHTFKRLRSKEFLRKYCFVVYASGFKFQTVRDAFDELSVAFHGFDIERLRRMRSTKPALRVFNNERKASNFLAGAKLVANEGFTAFKRRLREDGRDVLLELPGIGPITKDHLAKNIGLADVAKGDIWLVRAAELCGANGVTDLVDFLHVETGETRHVIDIAIWTLGRDGLLNLPQG